MTSRTSKRVPRAAVPHHSHHTNLRLALDRAAAATPTAELAAIALGLGLPTPAGIGLLHAQQVVPSHRLREELRRRPVAGVQAEHVPEAGTVAAPVVRHGHVVGVVLLDVAAGGRRLLVGSAAGRHVAAVLARRLTRGATAPRPSLASGGAA